MATVLQETGVIASLAFIAVALFGALLTHR